MEKPKFSVAMSVYGKDNPEWFRTAVESILNQTCPPDEVVLVVDGPVPESLDTVIRDYEQKTIFQVVRLPENRGLGNALRIAVEHCSYELIARMDSDDISLPERFEQQLCRFRLNSDLDIVGGDISEFIEMEDHVVAFRRVPENDRDIKSYMKKRCPLNHVTVMYKKSAVQRAGGYQELPWNEDYYLWIRMVEQGAVIANTGTVLVNVRTGLDMYRRRGGSQYFKSELFLQKYMLERQMIPRTTFIMNVLKRWIVQVVLPNRLRGWVFRKFARKAI